MRVLSPDGCGRATNRDQEVGSGAERPWIPHNRWVHSRLDDFWRSCVATDPEKAAHYADRAIEWLQLKLAPFTCSGAFYPILDLRRLKLVAHLLCTKDRIKHLTAAGQDIPKIIDGMHRVYGPGHPVTAVTKATVAKLCVSTFNARAIDPAEDPARVVQVLRSIKDRHINALEDIAIGFGPSSRVGRSVAAAVVMLDEEMAAWERLRQERPPLRA